jgi:hypothetical protein
MVNKGLMPGLDRTRRRPGLKSTAHAAGNAGNVIASEPVCFYSDFRIDRPRRVVAFFMEILSHGYSRGRAARGHTEGCPSLATLLSPARAAASRKNGARAGRTGAAEAAPASARRDQATASPIEPDVRADPGDSHLERASAAALPARDCAMSLPGATPTLDAAAGTAPDGRTHAPGRPHLSQPIC